MLPPFFRNRRSRRRTARRPRLSRAFGFRIGSCPPACSPARRCPVRLSPDRIAPSPSSAGRDRSSGVSGRPRPVRSHACLLVRPRGPSRLPLPPAASRAAGRGRRARLPFAALARPTDKRLR
ncbi:hypothetical protein EZV77_04010 [Burkholderia thailandensis]|nr:hypothetical protein A8H32_06290 [Burkholderia thailandensis]TBW66824.1 hypothetical protein EZV77_04010 [Burkholderia thailandensis]TGB30508.1 hypothetical protein C6946_28160 [Burkholderia thailandensis]